MAETVETLSQTVKKLKGELKGLRAGGAKAAAAKRKKKPLSEVDVLRAAKKRLRRATGRLQVQKLRAAKLAAGKTKGEPKGAEAKGAEAKAEKEAGGAASA